MDFFPSLNVFYGLTHKNSAEKGRISRIIPTFAANISKQTKTELTFPQQWQDKRAPACSTGKTATRATVAIEKQNEDNVRTNLE